jgi:hypothetical protein
MASTRTKTLVCFGGPYDGRAHTLRDTCHTIDLCLGDPVPYRVLSSGQHRQQEYARYLVQQHPITRAPCLRFVGVVA